MREQSGTEWNQRRLGDLFRLHREAVNPSSRPREVFEHYSIPAFDETGGPVKEAGRSIESNKTLLAKPTILVSKLNPRKPRVILVDDKSILRRCASTEWMPYVAISGDIDLSFYKWLLGSQNFQSRLERVATGSTNSHVRARPTETLGWLVPVPPLPEQRRIAEILDTLDEAIRKTEQVIAKLQQMKQGLLHDLLTRGIDDNGELRDPERHPEQFKDSPLGRIPREWDVARFGECLDGEPQNGLYKPSSFYSVTGTPIVRIDGFYDGVLAPIRSLKRLRLASQEVNTYGLEPGNILINRVNSIEFVGKAALVPELEEPVVFESNMMRCRLRLDRLHPAFAVRWVTGSWARRWFYRRAKSAIAQASVNQSDLTALRLPVPGLDEQGHAVELARGAERRISAETAQLDKLRALKHGLMDDLLTGRVRVPVVKDAAR